MDKKKRTGKEKKLKRKEEIARHKSYEEAIKRAYLKGDHLADFPAFTEFNRNGISVTLESSRGSLLSSYMKEYIQNLLKINMEGPYGIEWHEEEKVKGREMVEENALYIFVRLNQQGNDQEVGTIISKEKNIQTLWKGTGAPVVAFVQYRFVMEEELPVLYVYEIQLEDTIQGKGLGKFLMQLLELIARKNNMMAVVLTVKKRNEGAMRFYLNKLSYKISSTSPSKVDPLEYADCTYEILCKVFDAQALLIFENPLSG
ncbi:hypothetical protein KP509_32G011100 [Ceratopteris richardii]|uniref:N-alpha-acetyltransferase 40 n=1 Tax=Ceratopteris richardii TaxID=49495 RepID=A0A8T2QRD7_CERRI|nr:hypothetical protein KP509_32G011100 [Ceratopteris richardii]